MKRVVVLSDIHGNLAALEAVVARLPALKPDQVAILGDHALFGPQPSETIDLIQQLQRKGALVTAGTGDIAVSDLDYAASFPSLAGGLPPGLKAAVEWTSDALDDDRIEWLRSLPSERRIRYGEIAMTFCHASPGSRTIPLSADLDPSTTLELLGQTDSRVVCVGFTHTARVKDYGWKVLVDAGSVGMPYDGDATAAFTVVDIDPEAKTIAAEVYRASYDTEKVADAISARGLTGDTYRAATLRTGKLVR
ncbi:MAG: metallophosphoesterase [bacterium]|nr:metallophosphoesterase [Candidatus Aquidulcis sp.]